MLTDDAIELAASFTPGELVEQNHFFRTWRNREPDEETLRTLFEKLQNDRGHIASCLHLALRATLASGVRFIEWYGAELHVSPMGGVLTLQNAKHDRQLRGNGKTRHLFYMGPENAENIRVIKQWLALLRKFCAERGGEPFQAFQNLHRRLAHKLCRIQNGHKKLDPDQEGRSLIHFYSMRHVFAARMKKKAEELGFDQDFVAALMGHSVKDSAWRFYSDRAIAMGGIGVGPLPLTSEEALVRISGTMRKPLPEMTMGKDLARHVNRSEDNDMARPDAKRASQDHVKSKGTRTPARSVSADKTDMTPPSLP